MTLADTTATQPPKKEPWSRPSLRVQLMIIGVTGLAVALAAGSTALYLVLGVAVNRTLDNQARASAAEVVNLANKGTLPDPLPISGAQIVQIIDTHHRITDGSVNADRLTPLLHPEELHSALQGSTALIPGSRAGVTGPLRAVAEATRPDGHNANLTVVVAQQIANIQAGNDILRTTLLIGAPLLLAALAVIAWYVIGWTLKPVEALRRGAERISGSNRAERLPVPPSNDEIAALARTLNQMLDRLATVRDQQRNFVADAAHELRSPLASIQVQLEVAQRIDNSSDLIDDALIDIHRLCALVEDLLLLARADADVPGPTHPTTFDAQTLLHDITTDRPPGRVPITTTPGPPADIEADQTELRRAIANLLDNAVRHAHTHVNTRITTTNDLVTVHIIDDGPGVAPNDRQRVFQRFTRLDDARDRDNGGSGLGLSIVAQIVHRAHGTVELTDPQNGHGLEARINLPTPRR